jgi:multicomponent Na+:H+ antiporter subunit E
MFVLFFILWVILNGRITAEIVLFGLAISVGIGFFAYRLAGYNLEMEKKILKNVPPMRLYVLVLVREIIKASLDVMKVAVRPGLKPEPVIVEFRSGYSSAFRNALLANSITLTPGTLTLFQEGDRFVVHCLRKEYAEGLSMEVSPFRSVIDRITL